MVTDDRLVTAQTLEQIGIMRKGTAYRMAADGKLPHYIVGCRGRGVRFCVEEVLEALRRPHARKSEGLTSRPSRKAADL